MIFIESKPLSTKSKEHRSDIQDSIRDRFENIQRNNYEEIDENQLKDDYLEAPIDTTKEINHKRSEISSKEHSHSRNAVENDKIIQVKINRK